MWLSILYYAFFTIGFMLILVSVSKFWSTQTLLAEGAYTIATVVDLHEHEYYDRDTRRHRRSYKPLFEYTVESGEVKQHLSDMSSNPPAYSIGDEVEIVYDPGSDEVRTLTYFGLWGVVAILFSVGLGFFSFGGGYLLFRFF